MKNWTNTQKWPTKILILFQSALETKNQFTMICHWEHVDWCGLDQLKWVTSGTAGDGFAEVGKVGLTSTGIATDKD